MSTVDEYLRLSPASRKLHQRATKVFPSGCTRAPYYWEPYPIFVKKAEGCRIWDVDGREYIDYCNNMGPLILGHCHPKVVNAVKDQLQLFWSGAPSELEIQLAEKVKELYSCAEKVQFFPSGTEACMNAVRVLRAHTGREKIAMFEGAYHGSSDSVYPVEGIPQDLRSKVIYLPYNDVDGVEKLIRKHEQELAMVFAEATLKDIVPREGFLEAIREVTEDCDVPLAFDEVVTGLRLAPGGVQERFGIVPDLVVLGKAFGGGFPIGALAASNEIMSKFEYPKTLTLSPRKPPIRHPGTFNEHKIAMAAGLATLKELTSSAYENLEMIGQRMRDGLKKIFADLNITAQVTGIGSIFYLYFTNEEVIDDPTAKRANPTLIRHFDLGLLNKGINLAKAHCSYCSVPMTKDDANQTLRAMEETLKDMKQLIHEITPTLVG